MNPHRDPKFAAEKRLRALEREENHLRRLDREAPIIPLDEPYHRGWERWFEWSEAALRRDDAHRFIEILPVIQRIDWSKSPEFDRWSWLSGRRVHWPHEPRRFSLRSFRALKLPEERWGYFETHRHHSLGTPGYLNHLQRIGWGGGIHFRFPEYLDSKIGPHLITHRKVNLPEVTSRLAEIDQIMENCLGRRKLCRLAGRGCRRWRRTRRHRLLEKIHRREIGAALQDWSEDRKGKGAERSAPFSLCRPQRHRKFPANGVQS